MKEQRLFVGVVAFGNPLSKGGYRLVYFNCHGPCEQAVADWALELSFAASGTLTVRQTWPLSQPPHVIDDQEFRVRVPRARFTDIILFEVLNLDGKDEMHVRFTSVEETEGDAAPEQRAIAS